jgi:hypothetical protein
LPGDALPACPEPKAGVKMQGLAGAVRSFVDYLYALAVT